MNSRSSPGLAAGVVQRHVEPLAVEVDQIAGALQRLVLGAAVHRQPHRAQEPGGGAAVPLGHLVEVAAAARIARPTDGAGSMVLVVVRGDPAARFCSNSIVLARVRADSRGPDSDHSTGNPSRFGGQHPRVPAVLRPGSVRHDAHGQHSHRPARPGRP